jgi:hypothetical protein
MDLTNNSVLSLQDMHALSCRSCTHYPAGPSNARVGLQVWPNSTALPRISYVLSIDIAGVDVQRGPMLGIFLRNVDIRRQVTWYCVSPHGEESAWSFSFHLVKSSGTIIFILVWPSLRDTVQTLQVFSDEGSVINSVFVFGEGQVIELTVRYDPNHPICILFFSYWSRWTKIMSVPHFE